MRRITATLVAVLAATTALLLGDFTGGNAGRVAVRARSAAQTPAIPTMSCAPEPLAHAPLPQETGVYHAGPLILAIGEDIAQHPLERPPGGTSGSEAIAVLTGGQPVIVSVDATSRVRFSLAFGGPRLTHPTPTTSDGLTAMLLPGCSRRVHRFGGGILYRGTGCARLHVTVLGRPSLPMLPIGNTLRGCPKADPLRPLGPAATAFLGVACPVPNSITCDRIGIGVNLSRAATLVVVRVAGRLVTLSPPTDSAPDDLWLGYLDHAGLRRGPLAVSIPPTVRRWLGTPEVWPRVQVTAFFPDGRAQSLTTTVLLHPGFG